MNRELFSFFLIKVKKEPFFFLLLLLIIFIALFLRFYNYENRVSVIADNSRDVQVAKYAADFLKIPQIGQFSSAGPFFYGPWYYWFLEVINFLPFGFLTSWYAISCIYLLFLYLLYRLGSEIGGKWMGLIALLYGSVSPAQIDSSLSVWNPTVVPILVIVNLLILISFFKNTNFVKVFFLGFVAGLSWTIHFQSILTFTVLLVSFFALKRKVLIYLKHLIFIILGFIFSISPMIFFDFRHYWHNFQSIVIYMLIDQYAIWFPNSWKIYVFNYWPNAWAQIIGGNLFVVWLLITLVFIFSLLNVRKYKINKMFYVIFTTFILEYILFRYFRVERYQYYFLFAHPSVLVISAWTSNQLINRNKYLGIVFVFIVTFFSIRQDLIEINLPHSTNIAKLKGVKNVIYNNFPDETFDIYGCSSNASIVSHPIALMMYYENRNSLNGRKIGVCEFAGKIDWQDISVLNFSVEQKSWYNKSTETVYVSTVEWWKAEPITKGEGNFWKFIFTNVVDLLNN